MMRLGFFLLVLTILGACGQSPPALQQEAILNPLYGKPLGEEVRSLKSNNGGDKALEQYVFQPLLDSLHEKMPLAFSTLLDSIYTLGGIVGHQVRQQTIYGRSDTIWVVEVAYPKDTVCENYPHKRQLLFGADGRLFYQARAETLQLLEVWEDRLPVLMLIEADCAGNGTRYLYKYENGQMVNIFNLSVADKAAVMTYDGAEDSTVYYPKELLLSIEDVNTDGENDLVFEGQKLWLEDDTGRRYPKYRPYKRLKVRYEFIYNRGKDLFVLR